MLQDTNYYIKDIKSVIKSFPQISLINYIKNIGDVTLHLDIISYPIKITTDFSKYCLAESIIDNLQLNKFNIGIIFKNKTPINILKELEMLISNNVTTFLKFTDPFHIYQKLDEFSKITINYKTLESQFLKCNEIKKINHVSDKIPKDLLLSSIQISKLIINEIKTINRNREYDHYIIPDETNPYSLFIRLKYGSETTLGNLLKQNKKELGYDYIELKLTMDSQMHPYMPPKLEYIKPKIRLPLLLALMNLEIFKLQNWTPTITLEYLILSLASRLETVAPNYLILHNNADILDNNLEYEFVKLASITKEIAVDIVDIQINIPKPNKNSLDTLNNSSKYWKTGTGYGNDGDSKTSWDITNYIKEQELQIDEITKCLGTINKMITNENVNIINDSILINYIIKQINGLSMLELEKNKKLYIEIFNILSTLVDKTINQSMINKIGSGLKLIYDELDMLFNTMTDPLNNEDLLQIYCLADLYLSKYQEPAQIITICSDIKDKYCQVMKKLQFGTYNITPQHRFTKYQGQKLEQKAIMRILSEISSFKTGLPLNWESTIWVRIPKDNINLFSFIISGPKDTPYENGLFEFHTYLPVDYPLGIPQVLLHTTGNGTVRFNPNLYDSGKVCLSLLGTWQGQEGEKWNPKTSTFLQVMVSIQSLILVEQPYFNEPGWEREINTPKGKLSSKSYNEERQGHTIKLAMIDMINNPPNGFEEVVHNHFKMKKEEIINSTLTWQQESTKCAPLLTKNRTDLINLLSTL